MSTEQGFDFSRDAIPDSWHHAATEAPAGDRGRPLTKPGPLRIVPSGHTVDMFTASLTALAVAIISGVAWYELDASGVVNSPWIAVGLGTAIAIAVRLGGGPHDRHARSILSLLFYLGTLSVVTFLTARSVYADLYGESPGILDFEQDLLRSRLTSLWTLVAWFMGAVACVVVSAALKPRSGK